MEHGETIEITESVVLKVEGEMTVSLTPVEPTEPQEETEE
jgi:hypothetical protein